VDWRIEPEAEPGAELMIAATTPAATPPVVRLRRLWRRHAPLWVAALLSLLWLAICWGLGLTDPLAITPPLLLPWLATICYLQLTPGHRAQADVATEFDHMLAPVEAAEARLKSLLAKLDKRLETVAAVGQVAGERFDNMARAFEKQMNDMFAAATAVEKIAAAVDKRLRDGSRALHDISGEMAATSATIANQLAALSQQLERSSASAKSDAERAAAQVRQETEELRTALASTLMDSHALVDVLQRLNRSLADTTAHVKRDAGDMTTLSLETEKMLAASLTRLTDAIFTVREAVAASDQQLAASRKVYDAAMEEMSLAKVAGNLRQRKDKP
jgi:hypothetical protein